MTTTHEALAAEDSRTASDYVTTETECALCGHYHTHGSCDIDCGCDERSK